MQQQAVTGTQRDELLERQQLADIVSLLLPAVGTEQPESGAGLEPGRGAAIAPAPLPLAPANENLA